MAIRRILLGALIAALAGAAQAQIVPGEGGPPAPTRDGPDPTTEQLPLPPADEPASRETAPEPEHETDRTAAVENASRAADMIGVNIETPRGETIGQIQNVIVDGVSGEATHAVVAHGKAELTAVPWDTVQGMKHANVIVMERSRLEEAPSFTATTVPDLSDPSWSEETDRYWKTARTASAADDEDDRS